MASVRVRMSGKGQITIPVKIRTEMGWRPGDRFEFTTEGGRIYLKRIFTSESR